MEASMPTTGLICLELSLDTWRQCCLEPISFFQFWTSNHKNSVSSLQYHKFSQHTLNHVFLYSCESRSSQCCRRFRHESVVSTQSLCFMHHTFIVSDWRGYIYVLVSYTFISYVLLLCLSKPFWKIPFLNLNCSSEVFLVFLRNP